MGCCTTKEDHQTISADQKPLPREQQQAGGGVEKEPPEESDVLLVESPWEEDETENPKPAIGAATSSQSGGNVETQHPNYDNVFPFQETAPSQTKSAARQNSQLEQHELIHKDTSEQKTQAPENKAFQAAMGTTGKKDVQALAVDNAIMEAMREKIFQLGEEKAQEMGQASAGPAKKIEEQDLTQDLTNEANGHQTQQANVESRPDGHAMFVTSAAHPNVIHDDSHRGAEMFVKSVTGEVENAIPQDPHKMFLNSAAQTHETQNLVVPKGAELYVKSVESAPPEPHKMFLQSSTQPEVVQKLASHKGADMFVKSVTGEIENTSREAHELFLNSAAQTHETQNLVVPKGAELYAKSVAGESESAPPEPHKMFLQSSTQPEVVQKLASHKGADMFVKSVAGEIENTSREAHELFLNSAAESNPTAQPAVVPSKGAEMYVKSAVGEVESVPREGHEVYLSSVVQPITESAPLKGPDMFLKSVSTQVDHASKEAHEMFLKSANQSEDVALKGTVAGEDLSLEATAPKGGPELFLKSLAVSGVTHVEDSVRVHVDSAVQAENNLEDGVASQPEPSPTTPQDAAASKGSTTPMGHQAGTPRHAKGRKKGGKGQNGSSRAR